MRQGCRFLYGVELKIDYTQHSRSLPYLCITNETMAPLHVVILTVIASRVSPLYQETLIPLHGATLTVKRELPKIL